jgi:DNA-damage-inducible protein D
MDYDAYVSGLEQVKQTTDEGIEYWMGRDLMPLLDYNAWRNFCVVVEKAKTACDAAGMKSPNHFVETNDMVLIGSGAQRERGDWYLSRYACYLVAMNADSSKPEVGFAMTYFAAQARRQELQDNLIDSEKRLQLRLRVIEANKRLAGAAKKAGVTRHGLFQDAGHRGLYGMSLADVKAKKRLAPTEELLDRVGPLELSAHEFKNNLAEHRLNRDQVRSEQRAIETHRTVGNEVRQVMVKNNGVRPEDLPTEPSIEPLVRKHRKRIKAANPKRISN